MRVNFTDKKKIVSAINSSKVLYNDNSEFMIKFRTDAIPESVDSIAKTLGLIIGLGTIASVIFELTSKALFGFYTTLGGFIDFIQIISFLPLFDLYFPGNVRSFASILKNANTVGQGFFNPFFLLINEDNLNDKPYNYRFEVMGIKSQIFIENLGFQVTVVISMFVVASFLRYVNRKCIESRRGCIKKGSLMSGIFWLASLSFNYNSILRTVVILFMFSFLSSCLTIIDLKFDSLDEIFSFIIGMTAFLLMILLISYMCYWIQKNWGANRFAEEYSSIFHAIDETRTLPKFYVPVAMLRKAFFVMLILTYNYDLRYLCYSALLGHCVYFIFICFIRPYNDKLINFTLILNEFMIFIIIAFSG